MTFAKEGATWTGASALGVTALFIGLGIVLFWRWPPLRRARDRGGSPVDRANRKSRRRRAVGSRRGAGGRTAPHSSRRGRHHARPRHRASGGTRGDQRAHGGRRGHHRSARGRGRSGHRGVRALPGGVLARAHRPSARRERSRGAPQLRLHARGGGERRVPAERRPGRPAGGPDRRADRYVRHLLEARRPHAVRLRARSVRGAVTGLRARTRECPALHRGSAARGHRPPHRPSQHALFRGAPRP